MIHASYNTILGSEFLIRFLKDLIPIKAKNVDIVFITSRLFNKEWGRINGNIYGNFEPKWYKISAIVVTLAILSAANLHGQDTSLEMTSAENQLIPDTLSNCIGNYFDQLSQAQSQAFKDGKKKEWLKYMPSVGLTYTPAGEPRPGVTLSSSLIYTAHKDKQARLSRIKSIQLTNKLNAETEILAFKNLVQELEIMKLDLEHDKETLEIDTELFDFYTKQYETQKLSPSQYLLKKKDYQNKKERIRKADMMIQIHLLKINQASRCNN